MDCRTTFPGKLRKPSNILCFLDFAFCVARSDKTPVFNVKINIIVAYKVPLRKYRHTDIY